MVEPCPVCFYPLDYPPSDWRYCPSCGTQFGYHDVGRSHGELREQWIGGSMKWWDEVLDPPTGWNPVEQLRIGLNLPVWDIPSVLGVWDLPQQIDLEHQFNLVRSDTNTLDYVSVERSLAELYRLESCPI